MKLVFDMTPFKTKDGAVLELDTEEAKEFAEFYNSLPHANGGFREHAQCVRICLEENTFWRFYGDRNVYERLGNTIFHLNDIRIGCNDLGDLLSEEVNIESLLFA